MPEKKPPKKKPAKHPKRHAQISPAEKSPLSYRRPDENRPGRTAQVFDLLLKKLLHLSNRAVISFINGLFYKKYSMKSAVEFLPTETVSNKLRKLMSDTRVKINADTYIIEGQIRFDGEMMIRVFEYGYYSGLTKKTFENGVRTVEIAPAKVIYWEGTAKTPAKQTLLLKFPDGFSYTYEVETFTPLTHSVKELEKKGLVILLPFYVLKLRKQVENAKSSAERKKLSGEMHVLLDELVETVEDCERKGVIDGQDTVDIIRGLEQLYKELFGNYKEFAEENSMVQEKFVRYSTVIMEKAELNKSLKIARNFLASGLRPEEVAKHTELPLAKVKALLKSTAKMKLPA